MNRLLSAFALGLFLLSGCAASSSSGAAGRPGGAPTGATGEVRGVVTDEALTPIAGALVAALGLNRTTTTDSMGTFLLAEIPIGNVVIAVQALGFEPSSRKVEVKDGGSVEIAIVLRATESPVPYHTTRIEQGIIGCGVLGKIPMYNDKPNSSHNIIAACGIFGNAGYYNVDRFVIHWTLGSLDKTSGFFGETTWTPTQATGRSLDALWTVYDSASTVGGTASLGRVNGLSPLSMRITSQAIKDLLSKKSTITECAVSNCTVHTYHYGRANTLGSGYPADAGVAVQQKYQEYLTEFFNQDLPPKFSILPDQ
jgi:hypothetical protein